MRFDLPGRKPTRCRRGWKNDSARGHFVVGDGLNPTVAALTQAAAMAANAPGAVAGSDEEARARLGDYFAEVLLLDQGTTATRARSELGWLPTRPGLADNSARQLPPLNIEGFFRSSGGGGRFAIGPSRVGR